MSKTKTKIFFEVNIFKSNTRLYLQGHGSNLGDMDNNKNTVVTNCARNNHLNVLHYILSLCPPAIVQKLLGQNDIDEHTPLDWACYNGNTNVAEYLMYRVWSQRTWTTPGGTACTGQPSRARLRRAPIWLVWEWTEV